MEWEKVLHKEDKIAIYGLSPLTETVGKQLSGYQVVGLLDGYRTSGVLYGLPIISLEEAVQANVRVIIAAARAESCKVIAKRIGDACAEHGIALLDARGNDLRTPKKPAYSFADVPGVTKRELLDLIDSHDVISVDLFDTLLMRRTLFPTDLFEIVGLRLKKRGFEIQDFPQKRLEGERELKERTIPTLLEIYMYMLERYSITGIQPGKLEQWEWEADRDLVVPREEVCALLREAFQNGKPLYIVSDTFYTKAQLEALLKHAGITEYSDIMTSCEYQTDKARQLFARLRERVPGKTCLHIGDSLEADAEGAKRNGCTACRLYSGLELFEKAGYLGLWEKIRGLSGRIQAGMLAAGLFNSPFQFEDSEKKISVANAQEIGYIFLGPVITGFIHWLYGQVRKQNLQNIWFCARDGYLMKQLYEQLDPTVKSVYFLTSRFAASRAGMENEEDIRYVEEMRFSGSIQEQLWARFGISVEEPTERRRLLDYGPEILKVSEANRKRYLQYIEGLEIVDGDVAFFDFAARGTVQMYMRRMLKRKLKGFYFFQLDRAYMEEKQLDILPFYEWEDSEISKNFYMLEAVITSPQPPFLGFDENGNACFSEESRTDRDLRCIREVQTGIAKYFEVYQKIAPEWEIEEEKELGGMILSLLHEIDIRDQDFLALKVDDPFFNRVSNISDLL